MAKKANGKVVTEKATKAKADFKKVAAEKAKAHQTKRLEFIAKFGKVIAAAWAKLGDKANAMEVQRTALPKEPIRMVDYALVALGLRESKDKGLGAWVKADKLVSTATSQPKARKATKKANGHEAQVQA